MDWLTLALVALWFAAAGQVLFVGTYGARTPWRTNFVGRAIFGKAAALALVLAMTVVNHYLEYPYKLQVSALATTLVAVTIWWQFIALLRQLRTGRPTT